MLVEEGCLNNDLRLKAIEEYEVKGRKSLEERGKQRKRAEKKIGGVENDSEFISEWGSGFEFIAGYTSNGVPFWNKKAGNQ